jgi:hypothetical protein
VKISTFCFALLWCVSLFTPFMAVTPAFAHHSFAAEYDGSKLLTFTGVLTKVEWENPHGWFHLDVKDDTGAVKTMAFEMDSPNLLRREDANMRDYFVANVGNVMSVNACPAKNGTARAVAIHVKFMTGRILPMGPMGRYSGPLNSVEILQSLK